MLTLIAQVPHLMPFGGGIVIKVGGGCSRAFRDSRQRLNFRFWRRGRDGHARV